MSALDAASGDGIWRTSYPAPFDMNPATQRHGPGPKSTPAFADGRLFTLGMTGTVTAFDAETGRQLWQKSGQPVEPLYHTATSPIVDDDLVILHVGGHNDGALTAFDVTTGDAQMELGRRRSSLRVTDDIRAFGNAAGRDVHTRELRRGLARSG